MKLNHHIIYEVVKDTMASSYQYQWCLITFFGHDKVCDPKYWQQCYAADFWLISKRKKNENLS